MIATVTKSFTFDAAHWLPNVPAGHKCRNMHGHNYRVCLSITGPVDENVGWVMDFAEISAAFEPLRTVLDHATLNEIDGLANPTAEHIARWIWLRIRPALPLLSAVVVEESPTNRCEYRGQ